MPGQLSWQQRFPEEEDVAGSSPAPGTKMKVIILEGIATSGKTSVKNELEKILKKRGVNFTFVGEEETLMPILNNTDSKINCDYLKSILKKYFSNPTSDVIIFDRLYLSLIWRSKGNIKDFDECAELLKDKNAIICFMKIPEEKISERIKLAISHRDEKWIKYVKTKGDTTEKIISYYSNQQKQLLELLKNIPIPYQIFDTTDMDFQSIAQKISLLI